MSLPEDARALTRIEIVEYLDRSGEHLVDVNCWTDDGYPMDLDKQLGMLERAKVTLSAPLLAYLLRDGGSDA